MAAGAKAHREGRYSDAVNSFQAAVKASEAFGPRDPRLATSLNYLASAYQAQGNYTEAELLFKRSLSFREKALGPEHPDVATSLNNLGELYRNQGSPVSLVLRLSLGTPRTQADGRLRRLIFDFYGRCLKGKFLSFK